MTSGLIPSKLYLTNSKARDAGLYFGRPEERYTKRDQKNSPNGSPNFFAADFHDRDDRLDSSRPEERSWKAAREKIGGGWTRTNVDRSREIYSLLPLPLGDTPEGKELLAVGLEPTTYRLQGECSTIELCQRRK